MFSNQYRAEAAWSWPNSSYGCDTPWDELKMLAERAGVTIEVICQTVESATQFAREYKGNTTSSDDLEEVVRVLADDEFDFEAKAEWREADHPRDERGRFSNGGRGGAFEMHGALLPPNPGNPPLPWFNHTHELNELKQVHGVLERIYPGLLTRWKKELVIKPRSKLGANGLKTWECEIGIAQELIADPVRKLCTQIHEALHALSPSKETEFNEAPRWEEGAIEGAVRACRMQVAREMGTSIPQSAFDARDANHPYNKYYDALEKMRQALGAGDVHRFYDELLRISADKIEEHLLAQASQLPPNAKKRFYKRYGTVKPTLG